MTGINKAIELAGGSQVALARLITQKRKDSAMPGEDVAKVEQGHVYYWVHTNLPPKIALEIERALDGQITRQELLPELFV